MERLLDYFEPEKYILDIYIDKHEKINRGIVIIEGESKSEVIKLHCVKLDILGVAVNDKKAEYKYENDLLEITTGIGENTIGIEYEGKLNENMQGAYLSTYEYEGKTETIVATQFESHYAREAFPCIDEPAAKAVFELTITTPDEDDLILTNVPMGKPTPRMSTYLLAWIVGKFHGKTVKNAHGTEITTYCSLSQDVDSVDFANEVAAKSLEFYDDNFGVPYPLEKLVQVALPDFEAGAMENWGLVTYRESMLLAGKTATMGTKKSVALTVAHELSHQWFGDLVTMKWWDDLWLNESFASIMEYYAVDAAYPEFKIFEGFFTGDCFAALVRDAYTDVQSVHQDVHSPEEIATLFDGAIVYSKGAHLMLMLIRLMGWDKFCAGCRDYFEKYKYKNTVGDNLWECLAPYAEFDPKQLMHSFIEQPGYPVIMSKNGSFDDFTQKRFLLDDNKMPASNWPLTEVTEDMSGHFVLNLTDAEFEARLADFDTLGLEEKLRLLIDRSLVCRTDLAVAASLLDLLPKFKNESSAAVWEIVAVIVGQLRIFFEPESNEETAFKKFVGELVADKLKEIGLVTLGEDDENTLRLRAILLGLDYYAETTANLKKLAEMYDETYTKIDPEIRDAVLDAKIYLEPEMLDEYLAAFKKTADPEIKFDLLFAMTLTKDAKNLAKMVSLLEQPEIVKPQNQLGLFIRLYRNSRSRDEVFEWLTKHWEYVGNMMGEKSLDAYPRYTANMIRTDEEFEMWRKFFEPKQKEPVLARAIEIGTKEITARLELIKKDREAVIAKLGGAR